MIIVNNREISILRINCHRKRNIFINMIMVKIKIKIKI